MSFAEFTVVSIAPRDDSKSFDFNFDSDSDDDHADPLSLRLKTKTKAKTKANPDELITKIHDENDSATDEDEYDKDVQEAKKEVSPAHTPPPSI